MVKKSKYSDNEISTTELAKRLKVSRQTAHTYKAEKRLVLTDNGLRIKYKESLKRLEETQKMNGAARKWVKESEKAKDGDPVAGAEIEDLKAAVKETQLDLETKNAAELFNNSRALREKATAMQAAAEHEKFMGSLVSRELVEKIIFERARHFRDSLVSSSRRMAPLIADKTDIAEIEALLMTEYKQILANFAKMPVLNE